MRASTVNGVKSAGKTAIKIGKVLSPRKMTAKTIGKTITKGAAKKVGKAVSKLEFW